LNPQVRATAEHQLISKEAKLLAKNKFKMENAHQDIDDEFTHTQLSTSYLDEELIEDGAEARHAGVMGSPSSDGLGSHLDHLGVGSLHYVSDSDMEHRSVSTEPLVDRQRRPLTTVKEEELLDWAKNLHDPCYILLLTNLMVVLVVFILPVICDSGRTPEQQCFANPFSFLIYSHAIYWFAHLMGDQYLKQKHRVGRLCGYLEFYVQTKNLRRTPFYVISFFNAILLIVETALEDYCESVGGCESKETKIEVLRGFITLECMSVSFMWTKYIVLCKKFKKTRRVPDLWRPDFRAEVLNLRTPTPNSGDQSVEVFPPHNPRNEYDLLEIQTELLNYLVPAIDKLNENRLQQILEGTISPYQRDDTPHS